MINSGEINGVPVHASHHYLTELLRDELQFNGVGTSLFLFYPSHHIYKAVTDWDDVHKLGWFHHVAANGVEVLLSALSLFFSSRYFRRSRWHCMQELISVP